MKKKICVFALVLLLLAALLPVTALAGGGGVFVGDQRLTDGETKTFGSGTAAYDAATDTLTLTNATITTTHSGRYDVYGIYVDDGTLTINLVGNNVIRLEKPAEKVGARGIDAGDALSFAGDGSLTIEITEGGEKVGTGIYTNKLSNAADLTVKTAYGLSFGGRDQQLSNSGKITVDAKNSGISVYGTLTNTAEGEIRISAGEYAAEMRSSALAEGQVWMVSAVRNAADSALEAAKLDGDYLVVASTGERAKTAVVMTESPVDPVKPEDPVPATGDLALLWIAMGAVILALAGVGFVLNREKIRMLSR